jgi:hypothetical protein
LALKNGAFNLYSIYNLVGMRTAAAENTLIFSENNIPKEISAREILLRTDEFPKNY